MRALKNIDVAFVCMNLPYTMPPDEAAEAVKAFHPKVVFPYHYRGSDLACSKKDWKGRALRCVCSSGIRSRTLQRGAGWIKGRSALLSGECNEY